MIREAWIVQRALMGSLGLHVLVVVLFMTLPGGGPAEPVRIYTVRILEAPARPQARSLELSTEAISALKLESPSLNAEAPPLTAPEQAEVPEVERFPALAPPPTAAPSVPRSAPTAPSTAPPNLAPPTTPGPPAAPSASAATERSLPALPNLPAPAAPAPPQPGRAAAPSLAPPPLTPPEPTRESAMEQLRSKVRTLDLQVEAAPMQRPGEVATPAREQNVLSLRMYTNRVREAVKEQYSFPGGFPESLRTRVRVTLTRDGAVSDAEILESSGNERFDRLVCLAAIRHAKIPPVPTSVEGEGDTLMLHFTCAP